MTSGPTLRAWFAALAVVMLGMVACAEDAPERTGATVPPATNATRADTVPSPTNAALITAPTARAQVDRIDALSVATAAIGRAELHDSNYGREIAQVLRVVDGDTIVVELNGQQETVRYIGIDTPETKHPTKGVEPYEPEASERNRELVEWQAVELERDVSDRDRYGRLLRYVYVDGEMVNRTLVVEGYARAAEYPPDMAYARDFRMLEAIAREYGRGIWSSQGVPEAPSTAEALGGSIVCDKAYPTLCIPPSPPDLDCADIPQRGFIVLPPDPHRFDGDGNGIGCES